eukprot:scpid24567/ scgid10177/ 
MLGAKQQRNVEILPPLTPVNRQGLAVGHGVAFEATATAPTQPDFSSIRSPPAKGVQSSKPTPPNTVSPTKKKHPPMSRSIRVDKSADREIIDGIRSDLRATFSFLLQNGPPATRGQSSACDRDGPPAVGTEVYAAAPVMVVEVDQMLEGTSLETRSSDKQSAHLMSSASAPDVGQVEAAEERAKRVEFAEMYDEQEGAGGDRFHTSTPVPPGAEMPGQDDYVTTPGYQQSSTQRSSKNRTFAKSKKSRSRQSPSKRLPSQPPPTNVSFSSPNDQYGYELPPLRHNIPPHLSRRQTPRSQATHHGTRATRTPFSPYTSTQLRQASQQARLEERRNAQPEYVSIVGKVSFGEKHTTVEKRDGLLWVPCERCQHKAGRCSSCTVIRVGGGYVILEAGDLTDRQKAYLCENHQDLTSESGELKLRSRPGTGFRAGWKISTTSDKEEDEMNGRTSSRRGADETIPEDGDGLDEDDGGDAEDDGGGGDGNAERLKSARLAASRQKSAVQSGGGGGDEKGTGRSTVSTGQNRPPSARQSAADTRKARVPSARGGAGGGKGSPRPSVKVNRAERDDGPKGSGGDGNEGDDGKDGQSSGQGNTLRPPSAKDGRGPRTLRQRHKLDNDGGGGFHSARGGRSKSPSNDGNNLDPNSPRSNSQMQSRMKSAPPTPRAEDTLRKKKKAGLGSDALEESDEEYDDEGEFDPTSRHKLRKFKYERKPKDSMGAKECDWRDLKGIDPLDYLAKYCIVDQERIPTYERIYNNVDLDEDDEIDLEQLDFALKAVNNQLISDPEMDFVFHVLELAHRPKLDFKLYCLVAALSERVVMLDDMVKKLVNKMDFEALEVKMKKVKELFYLLADMEHRGGVVTTGNLAIELTAGGLTPEHVSLVTNHLNREKKGLVEFLDYLTYVPLFLEIHGSIVSNPLDQNRDK